MKSAHRGWNVSLRPLIWGFALSIGLTLVAYELVMDKHLEGLSLLFVIAGLGSLQALLQLVLFLHLGIESKPRWNLLMFFFMLLVIAVVIGGSLWIMQSLNYKLMPEMKMGS